MGLGKTIQTIGLVVHALKTNPNGKILILAPLSVINNWKDEIDRFTENIDYLLYIGSKDERESLNKRVSKKKFEILLTTYELTLKDEFLLENIEWSLLVVDEGHRLKNSNTKLFKCLSNFDIDQRILLTGTPIQNNLQELYALLCFIQPNLFKLKYIDEFCSYYKTSDEKILNDLTSLIQPFVLRRIKSQVNINLPTRFECILYHNLTKLQKQLYKAILTKNIDVFTGPTNKKVSLVSVLMNLRKISLHPYLMPNIEPEPFELGDHLASTSGKFSLLDKLLDHLFNNKHKVLLFSQFTCVLDIIQDYLTFKKYNYERIDGSVRGEERNIAIKNFNSQKEVFIFLLSTRAGGVGLNLVSADTCIFMDSDFNPHNDLQAAARIHRIGQQKPTMIIRLICKSTVEEIIYKRAEHKVKLANDIMETGQLANDLDLLKSTSSTIQNELCEILKYGLNDLFEDCDDNLNENVEFNKLLAPTSSEGIWLIDEKLEEKKNLNSKAIAINDDEEPKTMYEFEGKDYSKDDYSSQEDDKKLKELISLHKAEVFDIRDNGVDVGEKRKRGKTDYKESELNLEAENAAKKQKLEERKKKKIEDLKQKWKDNDYKSLKLEYEENIDEKVKSLIENESNEDVTEIDTKYLNYVNGDATKLEYAKKSNAILIHCVDNSGSWGRGGLFDALIKRNSDIPAIYKEASEMNDLNLGDVHFLKLNDENQYLALVVAQKRDKSGHLDELSIKLVESAFKEILLKAIEIKNTTIHMPRIGHNTPNFNWYAIERLVKKYFSNLKISTYIYYFKRQKQKEIILQSSSSENDELPDIFNKLNFYFQTKDESELENYKQIKRHLIAYNGSISKILDDKVTHIVVDKSDELESVKNELNLNKIESKQVLIVKYKWIELCVLKKKLIDTQNFILDLE
jgi:hypothetical protein